MRIERLKTHVTVIIENYIVLYYKKTKNKGSLIMDKLFLNNELKK